MRARNVNGLAKCVAAAVFTLTSPLTSPVNVAVSFALYTLSFHDAYTVSMSRLVASCPAALATTDMTYPRRDINNNTAPLLRRPASSTLPPPTTQLPNRKHPRIRPHFNCNRHCATIP